MIPQRPLPVAPRPYHDEIILFWLARIGARFGYDTVGFRHYLFGEGRIDLSYDPTEQSIVRISKMTRLKSGNVRKLAVKRCFPSRTRHGFMWEYEFLRSDFKNTGDLKPSWCNLCFEEDEREGREPYFRHIWASAFSIMCNKHCWPLTDRCWNCYVIQSHIYHYRNGKLQILCNECRCKLSVRKSSAVAEFPKCSNDQILSAWQCLIEIQEHLIFAIDYHPTSKWLFPGVSGKEFLLAFGLICWVLTRGYDPLINLCYLNILQARKKIHNFGADSEDYNPHPLAPWSAMLRRKIMSAAFGVLHEPARKVFEYADEGTLAFQCGFDIDKIRNCLSHCQQDRFDASLKDWPLALQRKLGLLH
jgi:hypothetical protein